MKSARAIAATLRDVAGDLDQWNGVDLAMQILTDVEGDELADVLHSPSSGKRWEALPVVISKLLTAGPGYAPAALDHISSDEYAKDLLGQNDEEFYAGIRPKIEAASAALRRLLGAMVER